MLARPPEEYLGVVYRCFANILARVLVAERGLEAFLLLKEANGEPEEYLG